MKKLMALIALVAIVAVSSVAYAQDTQDVQLDVTVGASLAFDDATMTCDDAAMSIALTVTAPDTTNTDTCTLVVDAVGVDYDLQMDETGAAWSAGLEDANTTDENGLCSDEAGSDVSAADTCAVNTIADIADNSDTTSLDWPNTGAFGFWTAQTSGTFASTAVDCEVATAACPLNDGTALNDSESPDFGETYTVNAIVGGDTGVVADTYTDTATFDLAVDV